MFDLENMVYGLYAFMVLIMITSFPINKKYLFYILSNDRDKKLLKVGFISWYFSITEKQGHSVESFNRISTFKVVFCIIKALPLVYLWIAEEVSFAEKVFYMIYLVSLSISVIGVFMETNLIKSITSGEEDNEN